MPVNLCELLLQTGRQWLGWMAFERDDLYEAAKDLAGMPETAWFHWIAGRQAFADRKFKDAAAQYGEAVNLWTRGRTNQSLVARLAPQPEMAVALADLGAAQLLSGDAAAAIANLDASIKADSERAQTIYLRARAKELTGQAEQALTDYSLASRTAFAHAQDLASGEAHLYRGIMMYRRQDYPHAEDEFASALNFDISATLRPDASAWRHMAAVAGGACGASRGYLEESLERVSPYFPKDEARKVAASCPLAIGPAARSFGLR
jgi:tetratricopeptide (TPR) repeat protein